MDLTTTCLAAANVMPDPGHPLDGSDLLPVLTGEASPSERILYWRMANRSQRAVRRGDWKYLKVRDKEYLFDIGYDPRERGNMARKRPDLLNELRLLWEDWNRGCCRFPTTWFRHFRTCRRCSGSRPCGRAHRQRVSSTTKAAAAAPMRVTASASTACGQRSCGRWNHGLLPTEVT
jgi:arylsulfatase A-like enzyme